jgi:hypothetical protein
MLLEILQCAWNAPFRPLVYFLQTLMTQSNLSATRRAFFPFFSFFYTDLLLRHCNLFDSRSAIIADRMHSCSIHSSANSTFDAKDVGDRKAAVAQTNSLFNSDLQLIWSTNMAEFGRSMLYGVVG